MRKAIFVACMGLFVVVYASPAAATDGNTLYRWCEEGRADFNAGLCSGYIISSADAFMLLNTVCPPEGVTNRQAIEVTTKFLKDNPARRHELAHTLIRDALRAPFPCRN